MEKLVALLLMTPLVLAVTIEGTVYNSFLDPVKAVVTINTTPPQVMVARDGRYSFDVPPGSYRITATDPETNESATAELSVSDYDVVRDMIIEGLDELDLPLEGGKKKLAWLVPAIPAAGLAGFLLMRRKRLDEYQQAVVDLLRKNGKRMTQKEIRKALPWSESKVSMVLTELESVGIVKRFRKGRAKIVVLRK